MTFDLDPDPLTHESWEDVYEWVLDNLEKGSRKNLQNSMTFWMSSDMAHDFKTLAYASKENILANPKFDGKFEVFETPYARIRIKVHPKTSGRYIKHDPRETRQRISL